MHPPATFSDAEYVAAVRHGDSDLFASMYRAYLPCLLRYLHRLVGDRAVAEDLVHDLFLAIWRRRETWSIQSSLRAYLFTAARNRARGHFDKQRVRQDWAAEQKNTLPTASAPPIIQQLYGASLCEAVARWLDELPLRRREVFMLSRYEALTYQEIADVLGISVKTVETQMSRALKHLRGRLEAFDREPTAARLTEPATA